MVRMQITTGVRGLGEKSSYLGVCSIQYDGRCGIRGAASRPTNQPIRSAEKWEDIRVLYASFLGLYLRIKLRPLLHPLPSSSHLQPPVVLKLEPSRRRDTADISSPGTAPRTLPESVKVRCTYILLKGAECPPKSTFLLNRSHGPCAGGSSSDLHCGDGSVGVIDLRRSDPAPAFSSLVGMDSFRPAFLADVSPSHATPLHTPPPGVE